MVDRFEMRAGDADRERVADVLRAAHGEGRLSHDELLTRIDATYEARSYGELDRIIADLPMPRPPGDELASAAPRTPAAKPSTAPARKPRGGGAGRRTLTAAWWFYGFAVTVNLIVWLSVSLGNGELEYFWPIWVAGPWGVTLVFAELAYRAWRDR